LSYRRENSRNRDVAEFHEKGRLASFGFLKISESSEFLGRPGILGFIDFLQIPDSSRFLELLSICGCNDFLDILDSCKL